MTSFTQEPSITSRQGPRQDEPGRPVPGPSYEMSLREAERVKRAGRRSTNLRRKRRP